MSESTTNIASMVALFEKAGLKRPTDAHAEDLHQAMPYIATMVARARPHGDHTAEPVSVFSMTGCATTAAFLQTGPTE